MNAETLAGLQEAYDAAAEKLGSSFARLFKVDTSYGTGARPSFQMIAYQVAEMIVKVVDDLATQELLVVENVSFRGFATEPELVRDTCKAILRDGNPVFRARGNAEESATHQQVVPYAVLRDQEGLYFRARRRADAKRKELRKRLTMLVGGHAERRDWNDAEPEGVFETCLRRELEEELAGVRIENVKPLGFINDPRSDMASHHLAFIHEVTVGGNVKIRRQAIDKEFGREPVEWVNASRITDDIDELDPWSQLVASRLFDATLPPTDRLFAQDL